MFFKKYGDLVVGILFLILATVVYVSARALPPNLLGSLGADFLPKIVAILCGVLAVIQIVSGAGAIRNYQAEATAEEDKPEYLRVVATIVVFTAYVLLMKPVGFIITSAVYLFLQMLILCPKEKRNSILFAVISVVCAVAIYYIFRNGLNVMLPAGILG